MQDPTRPEMRLPDASVPELRAQVEAVLQDRDLLQKGHARAVREVVYRLDRGDLRVAERIDGPERWIVHGWIQQSISLYFVLAPLETYQAGDLEFHDKVPPKHGLAGSGVRVVPPGVVRYGAHVEKGAVVMPGYVNIGARVGAGTMVDTWATVGSCAQVGRNVHLSGGVGLGGVLEPPGAPSATCAARWATRPRSQSSSRIDLAPSASATRWCWGEPPARSPPSRCSATWTPCRSRRATFPPTGRAGASTVAAHPT